MGTEPTKVLKSLVTDEKIKTVFLYFAEREREREREKERGEGVVGSQLSWAIRGRKRACELPR